MQSKTFINLLIFISLVIANLQGQNDTLYFFDFEQNEIEYGSPNRQILIHNNGGSFKDAEPYLPFGRTVISPLSTENYPVESGGYSTGTGYLYHSPTWYLQEDFKGISFNHVEVELDTVLALGVFYKFSFLIGNFKSHRFKAAHYGVKFSNKKIIKSNSGGLLTDPDIFFDFKHEHQLEKIQAIYFAENPVKYIYFGIFEEDTIRLPKSFVPVRYRGISYSDTAAHILLTKPTRVMLDNILIEKIEKEPIEFRDVYFDIDQDKLHNTSDLNVIKEIAYYLKNHSKSYILVQGYTDKTGSPAYNLNLSERRAKGIKDILLSKGVAEQQIITLGKGIHKSDAIHNDGKLDRKVSFVVLK